jgi:hypothetical protein
MTPRGARLVSLLLVLLLLGLVGYRWVRNDLAADAKAVAVKQTAEIAAVRNANRELLATIERARQAIAEDAAGKAAESSGLAGEPAGPAGPVDRETRTRALLELVRSGQLGQVSYPAPSVYKVATKVEKLAEVLGLTAAETDTLREAANAVAGELLAGAKVTSEGDQVLIEMGDAPAARQKFATMRDTFRQVLGEDGMAAYEALGFRDALEASLNNLGLAAYTLSVARVPAADGNGTSYRFDRQGGGTVSGATRIFASGKNEEEAALYALELQKQQAKMAEARAARGGPVSTATTVANRATLNSRLGPLSALLPAGF